MEQKFLTKIGTPNGTKEVRNEKKKFLFRGNFLM